MDLSVVIVNWNTKDLLRGCLNSIYGDQPGVEFEVLVVDNASTDGSPEIIRREFPQVRLFANQKNRGFAGGNNQAIPECHGRYVMLLNPDSVLKPDAIQILLDYLEDHPEAGVVGPRLINPDGSLQVSCYPKPTVLREFWRMFHLDALYPLSEYRMDAWRADQPKRVDVLKGACLLVRQKVFEKVGLLDESYFVYSEEVDFSRRIRQAGWELVWVPGAQVVHYGAESTSQVALKMFLQLYQGKVLYFRKHHGWVAAHTYKLILFLATLARLLLTPFAYLEDPLKREEHLTLSNRYRMLLVALPGM